MLKPNKLKIGDKIAIVSMSNGILGEEYCKHQLEIGSKRLRDFGLEPVFMKNSLKGRDFLANNPEKKSEDLIEAFKDREIKGVLCVIGGFDAYQTIPFLLNDKFQKIVSENLKIFIGFSDTTINHFIFYKLGLQTYYGHSFLVDFAELEDDMLEFSKNSFQELFSDKNEYFLPKSDVWYEERVNFDIKEIGQKRVVHKEMVGWEFYNGTGVISGNLLGGCLDTIFEGLIGKNFDDQKEICEKFNIFLDYNSWKGKILFLETSEEKPSPEEFTKMLLELDKKNILENVNAILFGKPQNEKFYNEYKKIALSITEKYKTPLVFNLNFGHSFPKFIIPYGSISEIDFQNKTIKIK